MTRLRFKDLPPRMQKQALKQVQDLEREKTNKRLADNMLKSVKESTSKYHSEKVTLTLKDGSEHTFDSRKEAKVYSELAIREKAGEIQNLQIQVPYELIPKQKKSDGHTERNCQYIADFVYEEDGQTKVVDVKGYRKGQAYSVFVIKRKLMLYRFGIEVIEM